MIKFGLVLVSYIYSPERAAWADRSFFGLGRTNTEGLGYKPAMQFTYKTPPTVPFDYFRYVVEWTSKFDGRATEEPAEVKGLDPIVIWSFNKMVAERPDVSHLILLTDDVLYHPDWLLQMHGLVERHPDARAWTVYRSSYIRHHKTVKYDEWADDHSVTSIAGIGCMTRQEWQEYAPDWRRGHGGFPVPEENGGGNTLDLHHAYARPGERWATGKSYWQHIGMKGTHGNSNCETAADFVGEGLVYG
jgi:hypothetical protein